jgi:hypothetical protein
LEERKTGENFEGFLECSGKPDVFYARCFLPGVKEE